MRLARKYRVFPTPPLLDAPSRGKPCDINVNYTPLKSTFNGLQNHHRQYKSIFIHLAVVGSQFCKIPQNSQRI